MLLNEILNPSAKLQNQSYRLIKKARISWQRAIVDRHREYSIEQKKLLTKIESRKKDKDGSLYSPLLITRNKTQEWYANKRMTETLKALQDLETSLLNTIAVMDTVVPSNELEDYEFTIPAETIEDDF